MSHFLSKISYICVILTLDRLYISVSKKPCAVYEGFIGLSVLKSISSYNALHPLDTSKASKGCMRITYRPFIVWQTCSLCDKPILMSCFILTHNDDIDFFVTEIYSATFVIIFQSKPDLQLGKIVFKTLERLKLLYLYWFVT